MSDADRGILSCKLSFASCASLCEHRPDKSDPAAASLGRYQFWPISCIRAPALHLLLWRPDVQSQVEAICTAGPLFSAPGETRIDDSAPSHPRLPALPVLARVDAIAENVSVPRAVVSTADAMIARRRTKANLQTIPGVQGARNATRVQQRPRSCQRAQRRRAALLLLQSASLLALFLKPFHGMETTLRKAR